MKRIFFSLSGLFSFLLVLTAFSCSEKNTQDPVEISWWHINSDTPSHEVITGIARDFQSQHPGTIINVTKLDNIEYKPKLELKFTANDPPDIFHSWGGGNLIEQAKAGYLRDITPWVKDTEWGNRITPAALSLYSYDGKVYGYPQDLGAVGFWYNQNLLEQAGYQDFPETWEEFIAL